jgi:hypothetical protein
VVAQRAFRPDVGVFGAGFRRAGQLPGAGGVAFALGPDPAELSLDPLDGLLTLTTVTVGLVRVVADDEPGIAPPRRS